MNIIRRRRALLYVPGDDLHKIQKATTLNVDSVCLDLEDGVAEQHKTEAQDIIRKTLDELDFKGSEKLVRVNPRQSGRMEKDLDTILAGKPNGIVLPKVENAEVIQAACQRIADSELQHDWEAGGIRIIVICESAAGILNLNTICHADPRLDGVIFGGEDLAADMGVKRTKKAREIFTARSLVVLHATEAHLQPIDLVCTDYQDIPLIRAEAEEGARMGFTGKQIIHPNQVEVVQHAFTPSEDEVKEAMEVIQAFRENSERGKGAFGLRGKMVDLPVVKRARNILLRAGIAVDPLGD
jgi:citrate lyase beta subunit